jgi:dipeptidyl aminopeptidase/acylaminoacyl peptidase
MEGHRPAGPPRQLTFNNETTVFYQTWAQDGRSLFCLRARPEPAVIRIYVDPSRPPDLVPQILPAILNYLAASPVHNRLAWSTAVYDSDLWRTLTSAGRRPDRPVRIAQTMREEQEPAISPDGASIAFMSARGTGPQMWVADFDGEKPLMIDSRRSHHPSWSPAGTEIAYEVLDRDGTDIYVIGAQGGASRCLTPVPSQALRPTWSRDGRWIYFSASSADGTREIWKVPARGGTMIRVTRGGGFRAEESVDGKTLYFTKEMQQTSLWAMPAAGGSEEKLIDPLVSGEAFQVFEDGIYSIMKSRPDARHELVFYSFRTARLQKVRDMDPRFLRNFAVSPDRQWLVYDTWRHRGGDLMMIEGLQ